MAGLRIIVRNEHNEVVEYHSANPVVHIDVPGGRYVITVSYEASDTGAPQTPVRGALQ